MTERNTATIPPTAKQQTTACPPLYARLALVLFGLSFALAAFSAWVWLDGDTVSGFRRGAAPAAAEWQIDGLGAWVADPYVLKKLRCDLDAIETNELGRSFSYRAVPIAEDVCFRDDGIDGPVFAVAVGDSFTFGHKVALEDVWTERLEKSLGADVVNLGLSGAGPTQALRIFERYGAPLKPRVVIAALYANDWLDDAMFHAWWEMRQVLGAQIDFPRSNAIYTGIRRNAYRLPPDWMLPPLGGLVECEIAGEQTTLDASPYAAQDTRSPTIAAGKRHTEQAILELQTLSTAVDAKLLVVAIPAKEHVYHDRVAKLLPYAHDMNPDTFCSEIARWCHKHDIFCLNMLPILREAVAGGDRPYFPRDGHYREEGHALQAREIERVLREAGLIASPH